jgi:hypothetical protein
MPSARIEGSQAVLETPLYPPAQAFEPPATAPYVVRLDNTSLAELMSMPAAWEIVLQHLPMLKPMTASALLQPHLGNFTVYSLQAFVKTATPETLAVIDQELAKLPPAQGPGR